MKRKKTIRRNKKRNKRTRKKRINGGVRTYTLEGAITEDPRILYNGKDFFRKMTDNQSEVELCKLLMKNPHKNIIKMYDVENTHIDMELLNIDMDNQDKSKIEFVMQGVKSHLQRLGIMYG